MTTPDLPIPPPDPVVDWTPGNDFFDVFVTVTPGNGGVQELRFHGRVGGNQPLGAATITDITAVGGSLDKTLELTLTPAFDAIEPALEIESTGNEVAPPSRAVPALPPMFVGLLLLLLLGTGSVVLGARRRQ